MKPENFQILLEERIKKIRDTVKVKGDGYRSDVDQFHNFKRAGEMQHISPEKALIGMWTKHVISILDIVNEIEYKCGTNLNCFPAFDSEEYMKIVEEKIGDGIVYLFLLEGVIMERLLAIGGGKSLNGGD